MQQTVHSRTVILLVVGFLLLVSIVLIGRQFGRPMLEATGLDWWNVSALLQTQARSAQGVEKARDLQRVVRQMARERDDLLHEVLAGERTVAEGLAEFRELHARSRGLQLVIQHFYFDQDPEISLRNYYRKQLIECYRENPESLVRASVELEELLAEPMNWRRSG